MREGRDPSPIHEKKATRLTSHFAAMHLVIQSSGNRVIPGKLPGQTSELFAPGSMEQGG